MSNRQRFLALFAMLALFAQVAQLVLLRELSVVFVGTEFSLGIALAAWCLCVALGSWWGVRLVRSRKGQTPIPACLACLVAAVPLLSLAMARLAATVWDVMPGTDLPLSALLLLPFVVVGPLALTVGIAFVFGVHALGEAAWLYVIEACGTLAGGILFHFVGVEMAPLSLLALLGCLLLLACTLLPFARRQTTPSWSWLIGNVGLIGAILVFAVLWWWSVAAENWLRRQQWHTLAPQQEFVADRLSRHGYLAVLALAEQKNFYSNGRYFMSASAVDETAISQLAHLLLVQHPQASSLLLLGGGLNGFVRKALLYPLTEIHYCELDPALVTLAWDHLPEQEQQALRDKRVHIHYQDGRRLIEQSHSRYDLVIQFLPEPTTAAVNRYYTREYFAAVKQSLNHGGVLIFSLQSLPFPEGELLRRNAMIWHTLSQVFRDVHAIPGTNAFFLASDKPGQMAMSARECADRLVQLSARDTQFHPALYHTLLDQEAIASNEELLRQAAIDEAVVNSDLHPRAILSSLSVNGISPFVGSQFADWTSLLSGILLTVVAAGLVLVLAIALWDVRKRRSKPGMQLATQLLIIAFIGFAGMAAEIVLLWAFLCSYGYIYAMLGLFTALFMSGVTGGGWLGKKVAGRRYALPLPLSLLVVYLGLLPWSIGLLPGKNGGLWLLALNLLPGVLVGAAFPLASHDCRRISTVSGGNGFLYAADMLGACLGALIIGSFALPLWGTWYVCHIMAVSGTVLLIFLFFERLTQ